MKTAWVEAERPREVTSPVSLIVSAFAPLTDARKTLTPQLGALREPTVLVLIDLGSGRNRMGGSALAQVYGELGDAAPDVDEPEKLKAFFETVQALNAAGQLLAYHDRSDGGLFVTLCEMMFASHVGVTVDIDALADSEDLLAALFNEELGAVLQVRKRDLAALGAAFAKAGLAAECHPIGSVNRTGRLIGARTRAGSLFGVGCRAAARMVGDDPSNADAA